MKITKMSNFCSCNGTKNDNTLCDFMAVNAYASRVYIGNVKYHEM